MSEERVAKRSRVKEEEEVVEEEEQEYEVSFRAYVPKDIKLQKLKRTQPAVPDMVEDISKRVVTLTSKKEEEDILSLAPKKAAWDLQRDLEPKLEVLSNLTEKAVVKILLSK
jgi:coiled-coil domain-containing protein 12